MKSLRLLSLAALLTTGLAAGSMAAGQDSSVLAQRRPVASSRTHLPRAALHRPISG